MTVMLDLPLELSVALKVLMVENLLEIAIRCWDDRVRLLGWWTLRQALMGHLAPKDACRAGCWA